jgi:hypothetical protein
MKLAAILALALTLPAANAASLAYTPYGGLTVVCYGLTCGSTFQALEPMTVTGLATYAGNFFSYTNTPSPVTVGLWDDQGQLLASAEVNNLTSTVYDGMWYGENIAPVNLAKDANYVLGTFVPVANAGSFAAGNAFWDSDKLLPLNGLATDTVQIAFYTLYGTETALRFPTANGLGPFASANIVLGDAPTESVPEPGTYILCGAALLALGLHRRASVK